MNTTQISSYLDSAKTSPTPGSAAHAAWLNMKDAIDFLKRSVHEQVPVYISAPGFYLYSVFVSSRRLKGSHIDDILKWNFSVPSGWGYSVTVNPKRSRKPTVTLLDHTSSTTLDGSEPFLFLRYLEESKAFDGRSSYVELNQRIPHLLQVHWIRERNAFSRINNLGDFEDVITVTHTDSHWICTIDRAALDFYMYLTGSALVRLFDVTRSHDWSSFVGKQRTRKQYRRRKQELFARHGVGVDNKGVVGAAWLRGFQLIRSSKKYDVETLMFGESRSKRKYAKFIALDWKHKKVRQWSCDPSKLGNYFVPSDLPFETSPAFFRPEVLLKYKQDPDKYTVETRTIRCRSAWSLHYDINSAGQVHAYLYDLARLPYSEQQYWQSFNEKPKGGISRRAFTTDFEGRWDTIYDPLLSLKQTLEKFPLVTHGGAPRSIWTLNEEPFNRLAYVVTESKKEWEDQVLELAKLLVDGLQKREIRDLARQLSCDDPQLGSIKLLRKVLEARGIATDVVVDITGPLEYLWSLRSSGSAHPGKKPQTDLRKHFRNLLEQTDRAMKVLASLVQAGHLNF